MRGVKVPYFDTEIKSAVQVEEAGEQVELHGQVKVEGTAVRAGNC
jgi:hypothetical protein